MKKRLDRVRARVRYKIGVALAVIAIVPLIGVAWFAGHEVLEADAERDRVGAVDASVRELVAMSELRTRLLDEGNWVSALRGIAELGLSSDITLTLTGIDVEREVAIATSQVDALMLELQLVDLHDQIRAVRADGSRPLAETGQVYASVERVVAGLAETRLDGLIEEAGALSGREQLVNRLRVLESATVARQAAASEFNHLFSAQFGTGARRGDETAALIGATALRENALAEISRLADPGSSAHATLEVIESSDAVVAFEWAVADLIDQQISGGATDAAALTAVLEDLDSLANTFENSTTATALYFNMVEAAGNDIYSETAIAYTDAVNRNRFALTVLLALAALSLTAALLATRAIARPIQRLSVAAARIRDGNSTRAIVWETGPVEIRQAARVLNEAGAQLALAERQAVALAQGDLGHTSLSESSSGALGSSLQTAVQTLTASMQQREEFRRRMTHEATHDGLTQLPNRNASLAHLHQALARTDRAGNRVAVMFIDLDRFKDVNDNSGHSAGDRVLLTTARRLSEAARAGDHVGRLGGDEFIVIAEPVDDVAEMEEIADRIRRSLAEPMQLENGWANIAASIGVAISDPSVGGVSAADLVHDADLALYRAKELGRNRVELCDDELRSSAAERADLDDALRRAIVEHEFVLHYQPIVHPTSGQVVSYEALVRWERPGRGLVPPDEFIPFAENSELIVHIDRWVVDAVARQIVAWDAAKLFTDIPVSINVSGRHLASNQFLSNVLDPLDAYGIDPSRLVVEVTEGALLNDLASAAVKLQCLRERGVRTAIDDFGTGYTSLAHLKTLPIDILKIDRSFTNDESAQSLVQLIIDTGHLLGATVTAEGIETADQAAALDAMGSDDLQGYLYGHPLPARDLVADRFTVPQESTNSRR